MQFSSKRGLALIAAAAAAAISGAASGQEAPKRGETVVERHRPDYSPIGARLGGFLLLPKLEVAELYDDNILSADSGAKDDFITVVRPDVQLHSTWSQHFLGFNAGAEIARYASNSDENFHNYNFGAAARADIARDTAVDAAIDYKSTHEDRASADDPGGVEPTEFTLVSPAVGLVSRWNRVSLGLRAESRLYDFDDVTTSGGAVVDSDDRDRKHYAGSARLGYRMAPEYEAFVRAAYNVVAYDDETDSAGFDRDSDGYELIAGTRVDLGGKLFGDLFAGYRTQSYDDPALGTIDGPTWGAALTWNPTGLTTVTGSVARTIEETTLAGASGYLATEYKATVDHELLRNLLLGALVSFTINDYEGIGRDDDDLEAGVYVRYLMNRNLYLSASYRYEQRDSNVSGADYEKNVFLVRLETQF